MTADNCVSKKPSNFCLKSLNPFTYVPNTKLSFAEDDRRQVVISKLLPDNIISII